MRKRCRDRVAIPGKDMRVRGHPLREPSSEETGWRLRQPAFQFHPSSELGVSMRPARAPAPLLDLENGGIAPRTTG
jgi:hypothetical protein